MEVSALNRWQSIGSDLYKLGTIEKELQLFEKYKHDRRIQAYEAKIKQQQEEERLKQKQQEHEQREQYVLDKKEHDIEKMLVEFFYRAIRRIWKGFLIGFGVRAGFQLIGALLRSKGSISKIIASLPRIITGDATRYGLFVGSVFTIFESVMRAARYTKVLKVNQMSFAGGVLAGLSLFLIPSDSRVSIMMFFLVRALEMISKQGVSRGIIPHIPHADVLVMMAASAQITYSSMLHRDCIDPAYMRFLDYHSQKSRPLLETYKDFTNGRTASPNIEILNTMRKDMGKSLFDPHSHRLLCDVLHGSTGTDHCEVAMLQYYREGIKRAFPVYLPVYLIPMILFRRKQLVASPLHTIRDNIIAMTRSSIFLASYCTFGMYSFCWHRRVFGNNFKWAVGLSGIVAGAMVTIEKPQRRIELTLYVLTQALLSFYRLGAKKGIFPIIKHGEVALFCLAMGALMHTYITAPYFMRPSYFSLFRFCFGSGGIRSGFPQFQEIRKQSIEDIKATGAVPPSDSFIVKDLVKRTIPDLSPDSSPSVSPSTSPTSASSRPSRIVISPSSPPTSSSTLDKDNHSANGVSKHLQPSHSLKTTKGVTLDRPVNGRTR